MYRLTLAVLVAALAITGCGKDDPSANNANNANNTSNTPNNQNNTSNTPNNQNNTSNTPNNMTQNNTTGSNNGTNGSNNGTNGSNNGTNGSNNGTNNMTTGMMCAGAMPTACFQNSDCPADQRCEDLMGDDNPCCVVGPRGTKMLGEECMSENECETAICVARNNDPAICSQECQTPNDCPDPLECQPVLGLCVTPEN